MSYMSGIPASLHAYHSPIPCDYFCSTNPHFTHVGYPWRLPDHKATLSPPTHPYLSSDLWTIVIYP